MNIKSIAVAAVAMAISLNVLLPVSQAQAGHRRDAVIAGAAGVVGGLILGGAIAERRHGGGYYHSDYRGLPAAHVESCLRRYRSYNIRTNTWTDHGYRTRVCYSRYF